MSRSKFSAVTVTGTFVPKPTSLVLLGSSKFSVLIIVGSKAHFAPTRIARRRMDAADLVSSCLYVRDDTYYNVTAGKVRCTSNGTRRRTASIAFGLAQEVFLDPLRITMETQDVDGEERFVTIGSITRAFRLMVVVYALRLKDGRETIRIFSARKATPERKEIL